MALVVKDRVKEVTTTTGTADLTLGGASYGFQSFSIIGNGNQTYYGIYDPATGDWEVGVGTYSTTGPTLTRDTVFESSNAGSKVVFGAGSKDVFVTYPAERSVYLDAAGSAVSVLDIGTLGTSTANITTANITAGTVSTTPTSSNDLVNKSYVDGIAAQGITYHAPVKYEVPNTTGNLNATYNNGTAGVGATLTNAGTKAAFAPDGPTAQVGDRILVYSQTNAFENGVYEVTTVGTPDPGGTNWVLTRAADADSYGLKDPNALGSGDAFYVTSGNTGAGETYVCNTAGTITFGTTAITFAQISSAQIYSAGTGLTLSNLVFSITPVGTAGTYGSASSVPVFTTNASGQVTSVTNTGIAISAGAVSGLAPSATTDTTNASNITSGTLPSARLAGSYTGITGVGTLTAGTWTATAIGAAYGGTGLTSYTVGDLLYADTTTSLAKLADVAAGSALISGGVGTSPLWGKIGLQTHVNGTLQVVNGGTGSTTATGARSNLGLVIGTDIPSVTGTGASGTWGINITGNAATATTATTSTTATSVSNSVTFNNSGAGAASGNGFNGSSALTVSYNTIGAPSTTGTGASGTWGISVTGNAATASNASLLNSISSTQLFNNMGQNHTTYTDANSFTNFGTQFLQGTTNGPGAGGSQWYMLGMGLGNDYAYSQYALQFAVPRTPLGGNPYVSIRFREAGSWGSWAKIWAGYADSAGSAGSVDYANLTNKTGGTGTYTTSGDYRAPIFYDQNNTAYYIDPNSTSVLVAMNMYGTLNITGSNALFMSSSNGAYQRADSRNESSDSRTHWYGVTTTGGTSNFRHAWYDGSAYFNVTASGGELSFARVGGSGYVSTSESFRAPIFYDSNDTSYYTDPNSQSRMYRIQTVNGINFTGTFALNGSGATLDNSTGARFSESYGVLWNMGDSATWHHQVINGSMLCGFQASGTNWGSGKIVANSDMRAPIFYDYNNTGYYLDPTGGTALRTSGGDWRSDSGTWTGEFAGKIQYHNNSWYFQYSNSFIFRNSGGGEPFYGDTGGNVWAGASMRAPVFYDNNDTGYYIDPNSTSNSALRIRGGALHGPNSTWGAYLYVGTDGGYIGSTATVAVTNGNLHLDATSGYNIYLAWYNTTTVLVGGSITANGNVTAYSDERLKKDWSELPEDFVERLATVKSGTYTRTDKDMRQVGVGAQSLQNLMPEAVIEEEGHLSVAYGNAALAACVELAKSVVALRAELNALRAQ